MRLYSADKWLDIPNIIQTCIKNGCYLIFIYGGRGIGKTYGALKDVLVDNPRIFGYMRRSKTQFDIVKKPDFSPVKPINDDCGLQVGSVSTTTSTAMFYHMVENERGKLVPDGPPLGYLFPLSTFANVRGFSAEDIKILIYDEFIAQKSERPIKDEGDALFNAYETINRNRELKGEMPLILLALSNSNTLSNPVFIDLQLVTIAERMRAKGSEYSFLQNRHIALIDCFKSEISQQKANTVLYEATAGTEFNSMAINNDFAADERGRLGTAPLKELRPVVSVGEICVYRHKGKMVFYVLSHISGDIPRFGTGEHDLQRFRRSYRFLWDAYMRNSIIFEEYFLEILFTKYFA